MDDKLNTIAYKLIIGEDYRTNFNDYIEKLFLEAAIQFFRDVIDAKLNNSIISEDWYKERFFKYSVDKKTIAISAGLNLKTIGNIFQSQSKEIVLDFANVHYDVLKDTINSLISSHDFDISLKLTFRNVTAELNAQESLVVINALTVLRSQINGGAWSSLGKRIEAPLMLAYVGLLNIPRNFYFLRGDLDRPETLRERDFYFKINGETTKPVPVEIKLMGKGNPESADGAIARDSKLFFAYQLSTQNKTNLNQRKIHFVELHEGKSVEQLQEILPILDISFERIDSQNIELIKLKLQSLLKLDTMALN